MTSDKNQYRAIFISDFHLGASESQTDLLLDFLKHNKAPKIYLVGDIIDFWKLSATGKWPRSHSKVVEKFLKLAKKVEIKYIIGNHDENLTEYIGYDFAGIQIVEEAEHTTKEGVKMLILHGHQFDCVMRNAVWLAHIGDWAYDRLLQINKYYNRIRKLLGFDYWSLSKWLKFKVKEAVSFIGDFEHLLKSEAKRRGYGGVICGHIHTSEIKVIDGIIYCNTGDWVESCSALVEKQDGTFEIIYWTKEK